MVPFFESELTGNLVYLRGVEEADLVLRPKWFNDPEVNRTLLMDYPVSYATTVAWFKRVLPEQHQKRLDLSICDKSTNMVIGMTGLLNIDRRNRHAQFYVTIGEKSYWGRRISVEVIQMVLRYAFVNVSLDKVYLWTIPANHHARTIYEKNGFIQEAHMKKHVYCRGAFQDIFQHRILKEEWDGAGSETP